MLWWYEGGESIGVGESGSRIESAELYNGNTEPVLVSLSDLYLLLDSISVGASGPSSSPI